MHELIQHQRLGSDASSIVFSNIPQIYTDLLIVGSTRVTGTGTQNIVMNINGDTSANYSYRMLYTENGGSPASANEASSAGIRWFYSNASNSTSNTFSNFQLYVPNYRSSSAKSVSYEHTTEQNGTSPFIQGINAGLWNNSSAINSLTFTTDVPASISFVAGSSITLYGINRTTSLGRPSQPKAIGGNITFANGYWVHTFTGSGTFVPTENLTAEYLVIAGGGGTTWGLGGGGGAGGYRCSVQGEMSGGGATAEAPAMLTANTAYPVVVGAGGAGEKLSNQAYGGQGSDSSFAGITSLGGGRGVAQSINFPSNPPGQPGGSGSGGVRNNNNPGAGTAGQGFSGGFGSNSSNAFGGGGGGGAGGAGGNGSGTIGGAGGAGVTSSITGTAVARAGGGGGCVNDGTRGLGTAGGGNGGQEGPAPNIFPATDGAPNTGGGGGGGDDYNGRAGGSGIVIVRYRA